MFIAICYICSLYLLPLYYYIQQDDWVKFMNYRFLSSLRLFGKLDIEILIRLRRRQSKLTSFLRRCNTWMLHTLYIHVHVSCYKVSISVTFSWFSIYLKKKVKIICNVNFSLIMSNRINIFSMCEP